jgi:hypothetical protein
VYCANSSSGFASRKIAAPRAASQAVWLDQEVFAVAVAASAYWSSPDDPLLSEQ